MDCKRLIVAFVLCAAPVVAAEPPAGGVAAGAPAKARPDPCGADMKRLCPGLDARGLVQCMNENESKLSPKCEEARRRMRGHLQRKLAPQ